MAKVRLSLSLGENTEKFMREESENLEITMSAFITMLIKNYEKEQKAFTIMDKVEEFKKLLEHQENEKN